MTIMFGSLRSWKATGVTSASDMLRVDILALEKARDTVESDAVPDSFTGLGKFRAMARQDFLVRQMTYHIEDLADFERRVYAQIEQVTAIERAVQDIDTDAAAQQFTIDSGGKVTDVAPSQTFKNRFEALEYEESRRSQRDALVARMDSVLTLAYAVDSALIAARPDSSFSDEGPEQVVDPEVARAWESMTAEEREAVVRHIAEERAREAGVDDFEVSIEDLEDQDGDGTNDDPDTDLHGDWNEGDRVLRIDSNDLDDPEILATVAHEVRHAQQHKAVDDLPWWWWEDFNGPPGVSQEEVEDWEYAFDHPKNSEDDGFDAYYNQATEEDARDSGSGYLNDLDKDELDRVREEAR